MPPAPAVLDATAARQDSPAPLVYDKEANATPVIVVPPAGERPLPSNPTLRGVEGQDLWRPLLRSVLEGQGYSLPGERAVIFSQHVEDSVTGPIWAARETFSVYAVAPEGMARAADADFFHEMAPFDPTLSAFRTISRFTAYFSRDPSEGAVEGPLPPPTRSVSTAPGSEYHSTELRSVVLVSIEVPLPARVVSLVRQAAAEAASGIVPGLAVVSVTPRGPVDVRFAENRLLTAVPPAGNVQVSPDIHLVSTSNVSPSTGASPVGWTEPGRLAQQTAADPEAVPFPESKSTTDDSAPPAPEAAGLFMEVVNFGRATLGRAIQDLAESAGQVDRSGTAVLYWLGFSSWLLGGAIAYEVLRRRNALPVPGLAGDAELFLEEPT
jgi:hypothetical protein